MAKDTFFPLPQPNLDNLAGHAPAPAPTSTPAYDSKERSVMFGDAMSHEGEARKEALQEFIISETAYLQASGRVRSRLLDRARSELYTSQKAENPPEFRL